MYRPTAVTICILAALISTGCQPGPIAANDDCQSLFACVPDASVSIEVPLTTLLNKTVPSRMYLHHRQTVDHRCDHRIGC